MSKKIITTVLFLLVFILSACGRAAAPNFAEIPAGKAYAEGQAIYFTHTETSDADVAELLSNMMKSPVLHVPSLAEAPDSMLADVYVFNNGLAGSGPFKFQADVFSSPPGTDGYSPLRRVVLVTWNDESQAAELKSEAEIQELAAQDKLSLEETGIVVNMPFITWDGGKR